MITPASPGAAFVLDTHGLDALKREARSNPQAALKGAAQQFEAIFLNALLKSMRAANPQDGILDSAQTRQYTALLDQQLAQTLSRQDAGMTDLAELLLKQFRTGMPGFQGPAQPSAPPTAPAQPAALRPDTAPVGGGAPPFPTDSDFIARLQAHALQASRATGIPARFLLGQAALETGWGRHEIRGRDGRPSYNVFGIKAGPQWRGRTVEVLTTEYVAGVAHRVAQKFRAYSSYAEAFADYARLLQRSPRYARVLAQSGDAVSFARGLQRAGYATDPRYAQKLTRVIGSTLLRGLPA